MNSLYHQFAIGIILLCFAFSIPQTSARFLLPNVSSIPNGILPNITNITNPWDAFHKLAGCRAGQKLDGLSKLKQYFHYFGYIPNGTVSSNFTDEFDDALESALKKYQQNFNLNITGELDDRTLDQISRPRCGNADIVNGTTTMNSGKHQTTSSLHTVSHYSLFPGEPRWSKSELTYTFFDSLSSDVQSAFERAFARWAEVIPLKFTYTESVDAADIKIGFFSGDHGDGEPFDGVLGTLAHAFSPPSGRFHLDKDETWVVSTEASSEAVTSSTAVDLESVAVHEIGHLLGLGHSSVKEAIMYPTISSGTRKVELASDDVTGIQHLYGSNPSYNASATSTAQESETSAAPVQPAQWGLVGPMIAGGFFVLFLDQFF